ncbi:NADH:ubiquinone oxidoreductase complex I intermediate-associated protein 30 [Marivirga tractuosa DSM 4126]|uniref:NADH:ubiquinone oxidoreductase complex I intermediate-associated protein 30 n=2 Tax=Marivirga TaxID=869806 RepID=E4TRH3_MARTH|nr:NADH:ubiquinone oxidoreductase complex I intermediate-associated protein 30 [Marivirga tractuosa DSM 4126]
MNSKTIFDFEKDKNLESWQVVDDTVMGGRSDGSFQLSEDGHGVFEGYVTTENNGGFSSVRHDFAKLSVEGYTKVVIKLKGDGKDYQFRIKASQRDYYSYIQQFSTSGEWEQIEIPLHDFYPSFRGRKLDMPNFSGKSIGQVTFLIGNKKKESFRLIIDKIELL